MCYPTRQAILSSFVVVPKDCEERRQTGVEIGQERKTIISKHPIIPKAQPGYESTCDLRVIKAGAKGKMG